MSPRRSWILGAIVTLAVQLVWLSGFWEVAEMKWLDRSLRFRGPQTPHPNIVLVAIDESSFVEFDRTWPFPRAMVAEAIERIQAAKPVAIGVDILFTEPSVYGPEDDATLARTLRRYDNVVLVAAYLEQWRPLQVGAAALQMQVK